MRMMCNTCNKWGGGGRLEGEGGGGRRDRRDNMVFYK